MLILFNKGDFGWMLTYEMNARYTFLGLTKHIPPELRSKIKEQVTIKENINLTLTGGRGGRPQGMEGELEYSRLFQDKPSKGLGNLAIDKEKITH